MLCQLRTLTTTRDEVCEKYGLGGCRKSIQGRQNGWSKIGDQVITVRLGAHRTWVTSARHERLVRVARTCSVLLAGLHDFATSTLSNVLISTWIAGPAADHTDFRWHRGVAAVGRRESPGRCGGWLPPGRRPSIPLQLVALYCGST